MQRARILVIEDNQDLLNVITNFYNFFNFSTVGLQQISDITEIIRLNPDLIVLDIDLAMLSGLDILRSVRRNKYLKGLPIVIITAFNDSNLYESENIQGAFQKPFKLGDLLKITNDLLKIDSIQREFII